MRIHTLLMLTALGTAGCVSKTDGVWLLNLELTADDCNDPATLGGVETLVADIYETTEGTIVIDIQSAVLAGTRDKESFSVEVKDGFTYTDPDCERYEEVQTLSMNGEFTKDLGITGNTQMNYRQSIEGCAAAGDDDEMTCRMQYEMTGLRMTGDPENFPKDGFSWGYAGGGGGTY